ncbi:MAG: glutaredoxin family protein [Pontibacterium sp.]
MKQLFLMSTCGCHLCEVAEGVLVSTLDAAAYIVDEIDIAEDDAMIEKYGIRIPVLVDEASGKELGWPFDQAELLNFLAKLS